jgi:hypothetical protein
MFFCIGDETFEFVSALLEANVLTAVEVSFGCLLSALSCLFSVLCLLLPVLLSLLSDRKKLFSWNYTFSHESREIEMLTSFVGEAHVQAGRYNGHATHTILVWRILGWRWGCWGKRGD